MPACPALPMLKGRNLGEKSLLEPSPRSVVIHTSSSDTAKCTTAPRLYMRSGFLRPVSGSTGLRSSRYSSIASCAVCVSSVFTSIVATGMPLMNMTASRDLEPAVW